MNGHGPELLKLVDIRGAIITIGAMGTQKAIAKQIVDGKLTARAHLSRDLAERAEFHLVTHTPPDGDGGKSERTWYYHTIPVAKYIQDAAQKKN